VLVVGNRSSDRMPAINLIDFSRSRDSPASRPSGGSVKLFAKGNRVAQANYGAGTVVSSDERYTIIEFDNHGRKVFISDMVALAKTDEPAPNKPAKAKRKKAVAATAAPVEKS
jgi:hypothetical protein